MWVAKDERRPVVARKGSQSRMRLFTIFFYCEAPHGDHPSNGLTPSG